MPDFSDLLDALAAIALVAGVYVASVVFLS